MSRGRSRVIQIRGERRLERGRGSRWLSALALLVALPSFAGVARAQGELADGHAAASAEDTRSGPKQEVRPSAPTAPEDIDYDLVLRPGAPPAVRRAVRERTFALLPVLLELRGGVSTIVGLVGVTASFDPVSRLTFGAGLGANTSGMQLAAFMRVRPLVFMSKRSARLHAVGLELGYSAGPFSDYIAATGTGASSSISTYSYERVQWLQPQITYETRSYRGFHLLGGVGVAIPFEWHGYRCIDPWRCGSNHIGPLPTITAGIGWAMGL